MKRCLTLVLISCLWLSSLPLLSAQETSSQAIALDSLIAAYQQSSFPYNGVILLFDRSGIRYQRALGYANFELQAPVRMNTKFRIASVSKQFAGLLAWKLVEQGSLNMEAPIATYVPRLQGATAGRITMRQLLTHTSGLPANKYIWEYAELQRPGAFSTADLFDRLARDTVHFEPGTRYEYCNTCYVVAAGVMEQITATPYPELLRRRLLDPLGMHDTGLDSLAQLLPNRAYPYEREYGRGLRPAKPCDPAAVSAAAGMYSTAEDLYRWGRALFFSDSLLGPALRRQFLTPALEGYAYGLMIRDKRLDRQGFRVPVIEHDGLIDGARAFLTYLPEKDLVVILLSNFGASFPLHDFQRDLLSVLYQRPYRKPKRELTYHFSCDLERRGLDYAVARFQEHRQDTAHYQLSQAKMNEYGFFLLRRDRLQAAIAAFQLNTEAFPDSWTAHDSLAEAYLKARLPYFAIYHYERSLTLNPDNRRCRRKLLELKGGKGQ